MKHTLADQVVVAITMDTGEVATMAFLLRGCSPTLPFGAVWEDAARGIWRREATNENLFAEIEKAFQPDEQGRRAYTPVAYALIDRANIPADASYRQAWRFDKGTGFSHDMTVAREIHLHNLRAVRAQALQDLDGEWMKAFATGNRQEAEAIEAKRQALRDAPTTLNIDKATTIEELKAAWPDELPRTIEKLRTR